MKRRGITRLLILATILSLSLFTNHLPWLPSTTQAHAQGTDQAIVYVNGPNNNASVNDLSHSLKTVTFGVYIQLSNVSIIGFSVVLGYTYPQLNASAVGISYQTNNVLGTQTQIVENCVDGAGNCLHQSAAAGGFVAFALTVLGGYKSVATTTKGFLFNVTFGINNSARGLFQVHVILASYAPAGTESSIDAQIGEDGYYTNIACPTTSQTPCRPPDVSVQVTPKTPSQGSTATFNVTVVEHNLGVHPTKYVWIWGDGSNQTQTDLTKPIQHIFAAITSQFGNSNCVNQDKCPVDLTVLDSAGVSWEITIIVTIQHILIEVNVGEIDAKDDSGQSVQGVYVHPGTAVHISAFISNRGTIAEDANVAINLEEKNLTDNPQLVSLQPFGYPGSQAIVNATWYTGVNTTPRAYALVVRITGLNSFGCNPNLPPPCIRGDANGTSTLVGSVYVLLIAPQVTGGLSLSLLQTTGLGALVLVGIAVALARLLKKPSYETEPL